MMLRIALKERVSCNLDFRVFHAKLALTHFFKSDTLCGK
jgi:hypothetical protein